MQIWAFCCISNDACNKELFKFENRPKFDFWMFPSRKDTVIVKDIYESPYFFIIKSVRVFINLKAFQLIIILNDLLHKRKISFYFMNYEEGEETIDSAEITGHMISNAKCSAGHGLSSNVEPILFLRKCRIKILIMAKWNKHMTVCKWW